MFFDPAIVEAIRDLSPIWLVILFTLLSFLGSTFYQMPMLLGLYVLRTRKLIATWIAIVLGSYAFRSLLKHLNDTERPPVDPPLDSAVFPELIRPVYEHPAEITTTSFPSGHAIAATVLWGLLVIDTDIGTFRQRLAVAITIVVIVASSRVVLAAHYVEDVVAGVIFGLVFLYIALNVRSMTNRPVIATFSLSAVIATITLMLTESTTGSVVLGGSLVVITGILLFEQLERHTLSIELIFVSSLAVPISVFIGSQTLNVLTNEFIFGVIAGTMFVIVTVISDDSTHDVEVRRRRLPRLFRGSDK